MHNYWHLGDCAQVGRERDKGRRQVELAWAAGFFDGEGSSFARKPNGRRSYPGLQVSQKHREVLDRFAAAVGYGNVTGPDKYGMYGWRASGTRAAEVMKRLWPYLGTVKRLQYERAVDTATERNEQLGR